MARDRIPLESRNDSWSEIHMYYNLMSRLHGKMNRIMSKDGVYRWQRVGRIVVGNFSLYCRASYLEQFGSCAQLAGGGQASQKEKKAPR